MKVLISSDSPFAHYYIRMGIARAFTAMENEVIMWDIHKKPAFDAFHEFEPDLFIGQTYNLTRAVAKCIQARPDLKVIMKAPDWGPISDELDRTKYPVLIACPQEIEAICKMRDRCGKPDFIYVHYMEERLKETHQHWRTHVGIPVESMLNAADIFAYTNGECRPEYKSDITFVGGYWGYKAQTLDKYLIPLCHPNIKLTIKVFGNQPWSIPQYCGYIPEEDMKH